MTFYIEVGESTDECRL